MIKGKKALAESVISGVVFLVAAGFIFILMLVIFTYFTNSLETTGYYVEETKQAGDSFLNVFRGFDYVIVVFLFALIFGMIATTISIATKPVYFVVLFMIAPFIGGLSYFFNYVFATMVSPTIMQAYLVYFPITMRVCTNLHWVAFVLMIVGAIGLYAKRPGYQEGIEYQ